MSVIEPITSEFKLPIKEWADLNHARYQESETDSRVIGFEFEGIFITNPFYDPSYREAVDPFKTYGSKYISWTDNYLSLIHI